MLLMVGEKNSRIVFVNQLILSELSSDLDQKLELPLGYKMPQVLLDSISTVPGCGEVPIGCANWAFLSMRDRHPTGLCKKGASLIDSFIHLTCNH